MRSQTIRKLNPINNPRIPPVSATNEIIGYDHCSLRTVIIGSNTGIKQAVELSYGFGKSTASSISCKIYIHQK